MIAILMMPGNMTTLGLFKIEVFWYKDCNIIIYAQDVTNKILSRASNYVVDVVMWPKFGNSSIYMRGIIITLVL